MTANVNKHRPTPGWVLLTALLLVALWLPVSSHDWLESAGWIHAPAASGHDADHDVADGACRLENGAVLVKAPTLVALPSLPISSVDLLSTAAQWSVAPPKVTFHSTAPPGLAVTWQFYYRTACLNQAPPVLG